MDTLLFGFGSEFLTVCSRLFEYDTNIAANRYRIVALSESFPQTQKHISCSLVLCPRSALYKVPIRAEIVVTCGMDSRSALSFSSITYDSAMLSVNRCFEFGGSRYICGERRVDYREGFTVYENLLLHALGMFA